MNNLRLRKLQAFCVVAAALACGLVGAEGASAQAAKPRLVTQAVDESNRVTLRGNVHPFARAEFDQGAIPDTQPINRIYLLLNRGAEQQAALDKLMREQVDANSPNFHKWLTPEQYGTQFGPAEEDVTAVKNWLSAHGFTGIKSSAGKTIVEFNGTVGTVRRAFATEIHKLNVRGEEHFANMSEPQIPAALGAVVGGVVSLHNFRKRSHMHTFGTVRRNDSTGEIQPQFTFTDVNGTFFGMGPADFAKIYNIPATANGANQSIAIVGRTNINQQDVTSFRSMFGLPAYLPCDLTVNQPQLCVILNGADPGIVSPGEEGEADLDVEWSGAVAQMATIKLVVSESEQTDGVDGVDASAQFIVDNNIAPVMSQSFGLCEALSTAAGNAFQNSLWQQAAAEGITVSVSTGDSGSAGCDDQNAATSASHGIAVSGAASTPFNVAVGGTDFDDANSQATFWSQTDTNTTPPVLASAKGYIPEIPWNDSCAAGAVGLSGCNTATGNSLNIVGGSGGPSGCATGTPANTTPAVVSGTCAGYPKPAFQVGITPADGVRDIPDVSLFASDGVSSHTFYIICQSDQDITGDTGCNLTKFVATSPFHDFQTVGGTSASTPSFAGIMALVNQSTGQRQGNANFVLYALAKAETFSTCNSSSFLAGPGTQPTNCVFMDITKSNNAVPCVGASPNCSKTTTGGNGILQSNNQPAFSAAPPTAAGYDLATGLGSINVTALLANWSTAAATKTVAVTLAPASVNTAVGSTVTLNGSVTSTTTGTPTGIVVIEDATTGAQIDTAPITGTSYSVATPFLHGGTNYPIVAHYSGDSVFAANNSAPSTVTSTKQGSSVLVSFVNANGQITQSAQSVPYGSPYLVRVDVENSAGKTCETITNGTVASSAINFLCPTGTVTLLDNGAALNDFFNGTAANASNKANLNNRGFIEDQPIQLNAGTHSITATYPGDASYNAGTSTPLSITITQAATQVQVTPSLGIVARGGTVTLTAIVTSASNSAQGPTGTVQFSNGAANLGAAVTCTPAPAAGANGASCTATLSTTIAALPPVGVGDNRWRWTPLEWFAALLAAIALALFAMSTRMRGPRRGYAYGAIALFLIASATLAGCGGGSNGGGGASTRTIGAKYSGDGNYATSTGSATVTVQ
jgi:hypothetical protein